jgi:S-(hydroxymethyl)glutathione dehydrogenase / alcohol dehydrogenase
MRAAVLHHIGDEALEVVDDAELEVLGPGMVRVAIRATGICHSDLSAMTGTFPIDTPCVLGHEGVGEVVEVGAGVSSVAVGDHVIATGVTQCGACPFCLTGQGHLCIKSTFARASLRIGGRPAFALAGIGSFSEEALLTEEAAVKIPSDVPWDVASLVGCGVTTGVGAVVNAARVIPGSSVIVFGCGGVGTAVIQAARIAGAAEIVAVDLVPEKRESARRFGATRAVAPDDVARAKAESTGESDGFDYGFEAVGLPGTIRATYDAVRRGGTAVIVGVGRADQSIELNAYEISFGDKTLRGTWFGSGDPRVEFLRVLRLWRAGRLDLDSMITRRGRLADINSEFDHLHAGTGIRTVLMV